jgi:hypothetical protein
METSVADQQKAAEAEWRDGWKRGPVRLRWDHTPLHAGIVRLI